MSSTSVNESAAPLLHEIEAGAAVHPMPGQNTDDGEIPSLMNNPGTSRMSFSATVVGTGAESATNSASEPHNSERTVAATPDTGSRARGVASVEITDGKIEFDLRTALNMTTAAWQSYLMPTAGGKYVDSRRNGTTTQFLNEWFATRKYCAVVKVLVTDVQREDADRHKKPPVRVTLHDSSGIATRNEMDQPNKDSEDDFVYLWVRKEDELSIPELTVEIEGERKVAGGAWARGTTNLPEDWRTLHKHVDMTVQLEPGTRSHKYTVELEVLVMHFSTPGGSQPMAGDAEEENESTELREELLDSLKIEQGRLSGVSDPRKSSFLNPSKISLTGAAIDPIPEFPDTQLEDTKGEMPSSQAKKSHPSTSSDSGPLPPGEKEARRDSRQSRNYKMVPKAYRRRSSVTPKAAMSAPELNVLPFETTKVIVDGLVKAFKVLAERFPDGFIEGAELVAFIENPDTDTQLFVMHNKHLKQLVVSFRGTEVTSFSDIGTDMNVRPAMFTPDKPDTDGDRLPWWRTLLGRIKEPAVHSGFLRAWLSVQEAVWEVVNSKDYEGWKTTFVGHSLGGALATLAAASAARGSSKRDVACYSLGCPRVGNKHFAAGFKQTVKESWRIYNVRDSVGYIPRITGFVHVGEAAAFNQGEPVKLGFANPDAVCVRGVMSEPVAPDVLKSMVQTIWTVRSIWQRIKFEVGLVLAVIFYVGIRSHMSSEYLSSMLDIIRQVTPKEDEVTYEGLEQAESAVYHWQVAELVAAAENEESEELVEPVYE